MRAAEPEGDSEPVRDTVGVARAVPEPAEEPLPAAEAVGAGGVAEPLPAGEALGDSEPEPLRGALGELVGDHVGDAAPLTLPQDEGDGVCEALPLALTLPEALPAPAPALPVADGVPPPGVGEPLALGVAGTDCE